MRWTVLDNMCPRHQLSFYAIMPSRYIVLCDLKRPTTYYDRDHMAFYCSSYELLHTSDLASASPHRVLHLAVMLGTYSSVCGSRSLTVLHQGIGMHLRL